MKIGFFGDSFCADKWSWTFKWQTYIRMIEKHYDANIVHLGVGGSSIGDLLLLQLKPFIDQNNVPDVCIFCWTEPHRLFHRYVRKLNYGSSREHAERSIVWKAANDYYEHLWDGEFTQLQYQALLEYADNKILPTLPKTTKIINLWSFGKILETTGLNNYNFHHEWKHGVTVKPSLTAISIMDSTIEDFANNHGPNHLTTQDKNQKVFNMICDAIDNYENRKSQS